MTRVALRGKLSYFFRNRIAIDSDLEMHPLEIASTQMKLEQGYYQELIIIREESI